MNNKLKDIIASMETKIDMLESEIAYLNQLLIECGFPNGIATLKDAAQELIKLESTLLKSE